MYGERGMWKGLEGGSVLGFGRNGAEEGGGSEEMVEADGEEARYHGLRERSRLRILVVSVASCFC